MSGHSAREPDEYKKTKEDPEAIRKRNQRMARAAKSGVMLCDLVDRFGLAADTVRRVLKEQGVEPKWSQQ